MLPFLKPQRIASTIIQHKNSKGETTANHAEDEAHPKHRSAAEKILAAIKNQNADELSMALEALMAPPAKQESPSET
jgi:hypothetical protein